MLELRNSMRCIGRAVEDSNPRHQVLETCVLPTELTAQGDEPLDHRKQWFGRD